ncbi:unnamed protein product [Chironomus riparius]|uniref:Ankyrin repeat domain-containing protein 12 n=1 Tax=Chironomus riparius TaxID=315576 RepID=A0A9N9RLU4_9DIPT|nr:unnamed protein product [Chironomus riparius]
MAPPPQRRNATHSRPSATTPMSERQQMALLMQMTSSTTEAELSPNSQNNKAKDRNERGETPLHIAAKKGDLEGAKKLLEQGSNPNVTDFAGWTPLHEAANHGHYHLAQILIKFGANVMATGLDDMTPLHDAASFGNQKLVKMLIEKGADPLFKNKKGKSPQDLAHPSVVNFFNTVFTDMANKQQKKTVGDLKKSAENEDTGTVASTSSAPSDIYEFVSTPKHSSCSSGDENPIKSFNKSSDEKSGTDSDSPTMNAVPLNVQQKRTLSDQVDRNDGTSSPTDDDSKRKKRKDSDFVVKDGGIKASGTSTGTSRLGSRIIGQKIPGPASKTLGLMNKTGGNIERKSPCETPNVQSAKSPETEIDNDDSKNGEGPKVPPLKIVIPQQQNSAGPSNDSQEGVQNSNLRANKTTITRNVSGHPYIMTTANESSNITNEKESISTITSVAATITRGQSPSVDSNKSSDDTKPSSKSKESRILRSSQRSGKDSKDDRSSNNSSPQLPVSSTPSPAAQNTDSSSNGNGNDSEGHHLVQTVQTSSIQTSVSSTSAIVSTSTSSLQVSAAANSNNQQSTQSQQQAQGTSTASTSSQSSSVDLHPRKRKIKASSKESSQNSSSSSSTSSSSSSNVDIKDNNSKDGQEKSNESVHPHDQPFANCYQMYIDLRKQIEQRHRNLHPIEPRPLKGLEDYLMNRRTYSLQGKTPTEPNIIIPPLLPTQMKDTFVEQEKERHRLKMKHIVEKEKLVLSKEQEILRVHCKAAQMIANQSQPFSVCTMLKDEEVYNIITPEQEEKYRNKNRERSHGRVFYQALKELDDKWDKIKEAMIIRHTNEAESLHAVQKMDWDWKLKELALCDYKATPEIEELHVPMVDVSDEYTTPSTSD